MIDAALKAIDPQKGKVEEQILDGGAEEEEEEGQFGDDPDIEGHVVPHT